jgi:hypothetical protein
LEDNLTDMPNSRPIRFQDFPIHKVAICFDQGS